MSCPINADHSGKKFGLFVYLYYYYYFMFRFWPINGTDCINV